MVNLALPSIFYKVTALASHDEIVLESRRVMISPSIQALLQGGRESILDELINSRSVSRRDAIFLERV